MSKGAVDDHQTSYTHASAPLPVKSSVLSSSLPLLLDDNRVKVAKGSTSSTIRKLVALEKSAAGNNVNTVRKLKSKSEPPPEGTKFFTFESYPTLRPEIDLYPNLVEQSPSSMTLTIERPIQTDLFLERPDSPAYIPAKLGVDTGTQIENCELFDFDLEVQPLLETLVSKTIDQAIYEVQAEEELRAISSYVEVLEDSRKVEIEENIEREMKFKREYAERMKYVEEVRLVKGMERQLCSRIASRKMMNEILPGVFENVIVDLVENGTLADPTDSQVRKAALVDIVSGVSRNVRSYETACRLVDELLMCAQEKYEALLEAEALKREQEAAEVERLRLQAEEERKLMEQSVAAAAASEETLEGDETNIEE